MNESSGPVCAVLDLGSNSFHLLIGRLAGGRLVTLDRRKDMVRLAQGLEGDGQLSEPVMARALDSLAVFAQQLRNIPRANVRVVGTNTLRAAHNADVFLERAEKIIGVPIDVISGQEEGRLIFLGVAKGHASNAIRRLVVDIGGGSTEFIVGPAQGQARREPVHRLRVDEREILSRAPLHARGLPARADAGARRDPASGRRLRRRALGRGGGHLGHDPLRRGRDRPADALRSPDHARGHRARRRSPRVAARSPMRCNRWDSAPSACRCSRAGWRYCTRPSSSSASSACTSRTTR